MALAARLERLERREPVDPFADMSEAEMEAAIVAVRQRIEAAVGMPESEYAAVLERQIEAHTLPDGIDRQTASGYVLAVKKGIPAHV